MAYTYNPSLIAGYGIHRMRFELGDTQVSGGSDTCALCDEEYAVCLDGAIDPKSWRKGKVRCLEAIVARFAMMVDMSAGGMSLQLSQRYDRWRAMLDDEKRQSQNIAVNPCAIGKNTADDGHHFWLGMQTNERSSYLIYPKRR